MANLLIRSVLPGVYVGTQYRTILRFPFNMVLIQDGDGLVLIDPVAPDADSVRELERLGRPRVVLLTSDSHERGAAFYRSRYDARVLAHADAIPRCAVAVDSTIADGEKLPGGVTAIAMPGTLPGMLAFWLERPDGHHALAVGDLLMHDRAAERSWLARKFGQWVFQTRDREVTPFPLKWMQDRRLAIRSLRRLLDLDFEALLVTHGTPLLQGAREAVARNLPDAG